jgi:hypothetical protein
MEKGIQGQPQNQDKLKQMMESAQGVGKSKSTEQSSKPKGESGLINNLEQTTTEIAKKVGEGIMKLLNPIMWFLKAKEIVNSAVAHPLFNADRIAESAEMNLRRIGK